MCSCCVQERNSYMQGWKNFFNASDHRKLLLKCQA